MSSTYLPKSLIFLMLIFCSQFSRAQENFISGKIVKLDGDTIQGEINYKNWGKNPLKISFRHSPEEKLQIFEPTEIKSFEVMDDLYFGAVVDAEKSHNAIERYEENPELRIEKDSVFLQTLIKGRKSLYYYKDSQDRENFYILNNGNFELLRHKKFYGRRRGDKIIAQNLEYLAQLGKYLEDCPAIAYRLQSVDYTKKRLQKLFEYYYNTCFESDPDFEKKVEKIKAQYGLLAGSSMTSLEFSGENHKYLSEVDYDPSLGFSGGIFLDLILPRLHGKWSLFNDVIYITYEVEGTYRSGSPENTSVVSSRLGYSYLKINNLIRYRFPVQSSFIFVNAGVSNAFAISEENYSRKDTNFYGQITSFEQKALGITSKHELGFVGGTGFIYKNFSLEGRYEISDAMSDYLDLKSVSTRYYLLAGYRFSL